MSNFEISTSDLGAGGVDFLTLAAAPPVAGRPLGESGTVDPAGGGAQPGTTSPPPGGFGQMLPMLVMLMLLLFVFTAFGGRKEKKKRAEMLSSLRRMDEVQTVGGIIGTISSISDDEITLKVDQANNTKLRFSRGSVQKVLRAARGTAPETSETAEMPEPEKIGA